MPLQSMLCPFTSTSAWSPALPLRVAAVITMSGCLMSQAVAQTANFRSVDTDSNNVLSFDELVSAFGLSGARQILAQSDHNGDGRLTIRELRQGQEESRPSNDDGNNRADRDENDRDDDDDDRDDDDRDDDDDDDDDRDDDDDDDNDRDDDDD